MHQGQCKIFFLNINIFACFLVFNSGNSTKHPKCVVAPRFCLICMAMATSKYKRTSKLVLLEERKGRQQSAHEKGERIG
jgi:hypothetical protein